MYNIGYVHKFIGHCLIPLKSWFVCSRFLHYWYITLLDILEHCAYNEAQNATQAASDALAAVTALAVQVKSLIAMVKKLAKAVAKLK